MGTSGCGEVRQALGVYVVGAIDPAERSRVDRHLAGCSACRDELAGLAGLPALLGRVTLEEAERGRSNVLIDDPTPPHLLDSMLTKMARRRTVRRRRDILLSVAASVAVLAGGVAGVAAVTSRTPAHPAPQHAVTVAWTTVSGHNAAADVSASVKYRQQSWGTQMNVWVSGIPQGTRCQIWAVDSSGHRIAAGGWQVPANDGSVWYPGSAPFSADSIKVFQITAHGRTLVTLTS